MIATAPSDPLDQILDRLRRDELGWHAHYRHLTLRSAFQPVLSITHTRLIGYEALLRAFLPDGTPCPPAEVFSLAHRNGDATFVDRLSRAVHVASFAAQQNGLGWLFLNVLPQVFTEAYDSGTYINRLVSQFGLAPERLVLEVLEQPSTDERALADAVAEFHRSNFLIALDDFGTGFSNFDRVWQIRPDIVKLDRSLTMRSAGRAGDHQWVRNLVSVLHQSGTMVLAEGVESRKERMVLMDADVDFLQGFWLARPDPSIRQAQASAVEPMATLWPMFGA